MAWLRGFQSLLRNPVMIDRGDQAQCSARTIPLVPLSNSLACHDSLENYFRQHLHDSCGTMGGGPLGPVPSNELARLLASAGRPL